MKYVYAFFSGILVLCTLGGAQTVPSLFSDIKAREVGDVLSVIIVENANASRESNANSATRTGFDVNAGTSGNLADFLPVFGGSSDMATTADNKDQTAQKERLTGRISVRIVEKTPSGMLKIMGERKLGVNGEDNLMQLEGYVRQRDITTANTIFSYNIADAKITYRKSGITNRFLKPGTMSKLFTYLIGGVMVAAGAGYFAFK